MAFTDYIKVAMLEEYFTNSEVYLALFTGDPTTSSNEVDEGDYARQKISFGSASTSGDVPTIKNDEEIEFDYAVSDWGTVTHVALMDLPTSGNMLDYDELGNPAEVTENTQFWVDVEGYTIEW